VEVRAEKVTEEAGQTDCFEFVGPGMCIGVSATDTFVQKFVSSLPSLQSPATTAEAAVVYIPVPGALAREGASRGYKLNSAKVAYDIDNAGTAADLGLFKVTLAADGTIATVATEIATTCDHTDAELYGADEHVAELTVTTPAFHGDDEMYYLLLSVTKATNTNLSFFGAWLYFTRAL
jgi:hypothetical protein